MPRLLTVLEEAGISRADAQRVLQTARPCAQLGPGRKQPKPAQAESKFGGAPDVAPTFTWPSFEGRPLAFLAQVRLSDVGPEVRHSLGLPADGLLGFFFEAAKQPWGYHPSQQGAGLVTFNPDVAAVAPALVPARVPAQLRFPERKMGFLERTVLPERHAAAFEALALDPATVAAYGEVRETLQDSEPGPLHLLGGHAQAILGAMEKEWEPPSTPADVAPWRLLLQLDSDEALTTSWGDDGRLYFWVRQDALARCDFSGAWCILQSQ